MKNKQVKKIEKEYDVCVIGAGASGSAVAKVLSENNLDVAVLEQGDFINPKKDYFTNKEDWEIRSPSYYPNIRNYKADYPVTGERGKTLLAGMYNAVGGSTIIYGAIHPRMHPSDFEVYTRDGVADDWPISYDDLAPYYYKNDLELGMSGTNENTFINNTPPREPFPNPPFELNKAAKMVKAGCERLGIGWMYGEMAILSQPDDCRPKCKFCGACLCGCLVGDKSSADVTYIPAAIRRGADILTNSRVREIEVDESGRCSSVVYYDVNGNEQRLKAKCFVLACNAIGTARILLNSKSSLFPDGLANSSGMVGRNFMAHSVAIIDGFFDERIEAYKGINGHIMIQDFYETNMLNNFVRGYSMFTQATLGPVWFAKGGSTRKPLPWGEAHKEYMKNNFAHNVSLVILGEDLPSEENRITLDPGVVDSNGIPVPKITYKMKENTLNLMNHGLARAEDILWAAGAYEVKKIGIMPIALHLMGTARMGNDASRSVVNSWCQAHDVDNLFIADGSCFVTSGAVNPTHTIQAIALRCAEYIVNTF